MEQKKQYRKENELIALLTVCYMISYMTRINYNCILVEIEAATNMARDLLSMAVTGSFFSYAAGQVVSGILGDRFSPKKLLLAGLFVTISMNLLILLCRQPYQFVVVWTINGFAQSFMWPPIIRIMHEALSKDGYKRGSMIVSWGGSFGTIAVYLLAPVLISMASWKAVFLCSATCGIILIPIWCLRCPEVSGSKKIAREEPRAAAPQRFLTPLMFCIMIVSVLQGMVRDSVTTWMPTFIYDTYHLGTIVSIFSGVLLPIFNVLCYYFSAMLYSKKLKNPISCSAVFFCLGTAAAVLLILLNGLSAGASVLMAAVLAGCMQGISFMMVTMVPTYYKNVATVSGVLNASIYMGGAASTYVVAVISQRAGWNKVTILWAIAALLGTVLCAVCIKSFRKQHCSVSRGNQ